MAAARTGHEELVEFFIGTPDCSRDDMVDALELLGTEHWLKGKVDQCLSLWQRAMEERRRPGKPVVWKREADGKVAAYGNAVEVQTMEELQKLKGSRDKHELGVQSMLIRERVLGKTNEDTSHIVKYKAAPFADEGRFDRAIELTLHILENLKSVCPFKSHTVNVYKFLVNLLASGLEVEGSGGVRVSFSQTFACLKWAVSDFERGKTGQPGSKIEAFVERRQNLLKMTLHMICLLYQTLDRATSEENEEFIEQVESFVKKGYCDPKGNTLLHMACDADTSVFDTGDNPYTGCIFPAPEVVHVLLDSGCDVSARNEAGQTALQVAQEQEGDVSQIINLFVAAGL